MNKHYFLGKKRRVVFSKRLAFALLRYDIASQFPGQNVSKTLCLVAITAGLLCFVLVWTACGSEVNSKSATTATSSQPAPAKSSTAPAGATVYRQYCVSCHGADGKLGLNGAGDLTQSTLPLQERIIQISKGKNMMTAFEEILSPQEIEAVATFTLSLKK